MSDTFVASENMGSSLFVNILSADPHTVELCDAGDLAFGVTMEGSNAAPIPGITQYAAATGESLTVYTIGDTCEVICGAAVNAGAYVKPDAAAKAVAASSTNPYSGIALNTTTAAGQKLKIKLEHGTTP